MTRNNAAAVAFPKPNAATPIPTTVLTTIFTVAVFWAAVLLFVLEPMFAKMLLPVFGGSPSVWNTCMVFFQAALLLAYMYSHKVAANPISPALHCLAVLAPLPFLPIALRAVGGGSTSTSHPIVTVLVMALASIGLPFFFTATTSPLLQRWFADTKHPYAAEPYFLYAASNAGSIIGLALYPILLEPLLSLRQQARLWSAGYIFFVALILACGLLRWRYGVARNEPAVITFPGVKLFAKDKLLWAALAFVPASLMYGVTAQLSTDFPPVPLLWVLPLALYLLTFIVAFSARFHRWQGVAKYLPTLLTGAMMLYLLGDTHGRFWAARSLVKLFFYAAVALAFHSELARRRPGRADLTSYFLWISAGGVAGGVLNTLVAPVVFSNTWEYPLTLIAAAALAMVIPSVGRRQVNPKILAFSFTAVCLAAIVVRATHVSGSRWLGVLIGCAVLVLIHVPVRVLAIALTLIAVLIGRIDSIAMPTLRTERSFFGVYRIISDRHHTWNLLIHGNTVHGGQPTSGAMRSSPQVTYYQPAAGVFAQITGKPYARIAVVGLGTGTLGCYAMAGQSVTFFEIDPLVEKIAGNANYFTFMKDCPAQKNVVLGDARMTLERTVPHAFDLIALDAFSSDSIPVHLLTAEAFQMYRQKLTADGVLLIHISNRYLDLAPVVLASGKKIGFSALVYHDRPDTKSGVGQWHLPSDWVVIAPSDETAAALRSQGWTNLPGPPLTWTDERSSVVSVVVWPDWMRRALAKLAPHRPRSAEKQ